MGEGVTAALVTGVLSLAGVLVTLVSRRRGSGDLQKLNMQKLRSELERTQRTAAQLRAEVERYRAAYLGLSELTQELLEEKTPAEHP